MKLKSLYLILMLVIGTSLMAQDKYEQGMVEQVGLTCAISLEGKSVVREKLTGAEANEAPVLKKLTELREQGWEVWNSSVQPGGPIYFIRRKLK